MAAEGAASAHQGAFTSSARSDTIQPVPSSSSDPLAFLSDTAPAALSPPVQSSVPLSALPCRSWHCSSPGKALLTGGYLVLDRRYCGLVVALSARFHTVLAPCSDRRILRAIDTPSHPALYHTHSSQPAHLQPDSQPQPHSFQPVTPSRQPPPLSRPVADAGESSGGSLTAAFVLHAPQRSSRLVEYWVRVAVDGGVGGVEGGVTAIRRHPAASEDNPFVLCSIYYTLHFLSAVLPPAVMRSKLACPILLHVKGDHQFYSATPLPDSDPRWLDGKTGLGSSATLVSSLVGALCHYFQLIDDDHNTQLMLHSALLPHHSTTGVSLGSQDHTGSMLARPVSSLDSSFTVVGHDLSTFSTSSSSSLPVCSTLSLPRSARLSICHRLSQLAHCAAQGKIGSGFDVSTAYFGSQVYRRFSQRCIADVLPHSVKQPLAVNRAALLQCVLPEVQHHYHQQTSSNVDSSDLLPSTATSLSSAAPLSAPSSPSSAKSPDSTSPSSSSSSLSELDRTPSPVTAPSCSLCSALRNRPQWDEVVNPLGLPSFLCVLLADVQGGAHTPGMVQQVLRWRERSPTDDSDQLYHRMAALMAAVELSLSTLAAQEEAASHCPAHRRLLDETVAQLGRTRPDEWTGLLSDSPRFANSPAPNPVSEWLVRSLLDLRSSFVSIRALYRLMGEASGVSIEPHTQTQLCDATMALEGVVAAGVPGAGGEDAIFILAIRHERLTTALDTAWQQLSQQRALGNGGGGVSRSIRLLPVEQATDGIMFRTDNQLCLDTLHLPTRNQ